MLRRLRIEEGWLTLILTWGMVMIAATTVIDGEFIDGLEYLPLISTLAVITGLALAKSNFSGRIAFFIALIYGLFLIGYLLGRGMPESLTWQERINDLLQRQYTWFVKAVTEASSRDGLIFVIHTSFVFWFLGVSATWYTFRKLRVWRVILPSGLVLISVIYYYFGPKPLIAYLALYTLVALVYVARTHLVTREKDWLKSSVRYESGIHFSFLRASVVFGLIALIIAWGIPSAAANPVVSETLGETGVSGVWQEFQDNWTRLFASLRSYGTVTSDPFRDTLSLGGPRSVTNNLIMDVYVEERVPFVYWQAVTYDTYRNGGWSITADTDTSLILPDEEPIAEVDYALRQNVTQRIQNFVPNTGTVYGAPEPVKSDRQLIVTQRRTDQGEIVLHSVFSRFVLKQGEEYEVTSSYSLADAEMLRNASENYPQWVLDSYLQVPEEITPETRQLAVDLTAGLTNQFDKAIAVRNYLRENIAYNDQIAAPPDGVEPVHYILFEDQEAYCNYYASAMIMMLRSVGVPARFVTGYTQGEWDEDSNSYRVRANNSHAWTEVYFPQYGWIPFEATASIPAGNRSELLTNPGDAFGAEGFIPNTEEEDFGPDVELDESAQLEDFLEGDEGANADSGASTPGDWLLRGGIAAAILSAAIALSLLLTRANRRVEASVEGSYSRLGKWAPWLGVFIQPAQTPYERANELVAAVPEGKEPIRNLTYQYVRQLFSQTRAVDEGFDPQREWNSLRFPMIRRTIRHQLRQLRRRIDRGNDTG